MTGFGSAEGSVAGGMLRVEIRSVNHRFFSLSARLQPELAAGETELRDRLRQEFERGHFSVAVRWVIAPASGNGLRVNPERAREAAARLREVQTAAGIGGEVPLELVLSQPDVVVSSNGAERAVEWAALEPIVAEAAAQCRAVRLTEGLVLAQELRDRLTAIAVEVERVRAQAPIRVLAERDRLRQAVAQLLESHRVDEQRLAQEVALLAERHDVTEELVRLGAHLEACRETLRSEGAIGKRLGFLAQELGREMNTIGAKANDVVMQHAVIAMKGELERFREQLENLE
ncbi:MAG: YicC/YloC family endoribonuclease [Gemmatimonadales bacterium]